MGEIFSTGLSLNHTNPIVIIRDTDTPANMNGNMSLDLKYRAMKAASHSTGTLCSVKQHPQQCRGCGLMLLPRRTYVRRLYVYYVEPTYVSYGFENANDYVLPAHNHNH